MATKKVKETVASGITDSQPIETAPENEETDIEKSVSEINPEPKTKMTSVKIKKEIPLDRMIHIFNGSPGGLTIRLPKEGYDMRFEKFKDNDYISYGELRLLRNASPRFFEENWILFDDEDLDIVEALNLQKFYKTVLNPDEIDKFILNSSEDKIKKTISDLSNGQKKLVGYRAVELIDEGVLDSRKIINVLETSLGIDIVEKG